MIGRGLGLISENLDSFEVEIMEAVKQHLKLEEDSYLVLKQNKLIQIVTFYHALKLLKFDQEFLTEI